MTRRLPRSPANRPALALLLPTALLLCAARANADVLPDGDTDGGAPATRDELEVEQIVITGLQNRVETVAPVRASLAETEPQAIISRKFIEESAARVADYSEIAMFAPSIVSTPNPNGPGSGDGSKIAMRGFGDGNYNITYDGIPWGDTNGPSHHGTAFFTASTIGGVIIDRGPGNATDLGQANFGGAVNLLSLPFEPKASFTQVATYGSFDTWQAVTTFQTGTVDQAHGAQLIVNLQENHTAGYQSFTGSSSQSQFFKATVPLGESFRLTGLYTHTGGDYNKSDVGNPPVSITEVLGEKFALSNDPTRQDYFGYNTVNKKTDFEYLHLEGKLGAGWGIDNMLYGYYYDNDTVSGAIVPPFTATSNLVYTSAAVLAAAYPARGAGYATSLRTAGIPGYLKQNQYAVGGDILKFTKDTDHGKLTFGGMYEKAQTSRYIIDFDLVTGLPDYREKAASQPGPSGAYVQVPLNISYNEWSGWHQYQLFAQYEWKPTPQLTVTPGAKYVNFALYVHAPVAKLAGGSQPLYFDNTYTKSLPFLTANYHLRNNWSVYAQYAQGFLVPKIGNLYVSNIQAPIVPQLSTNYQLGTVLNLDKASLDADVYYIDFQHKIQTFTDAVSNQSYDTNTGGATYRGVELEGTWAPVRAFSVYANYSYNQALGKDDPANPLSNGHQLTSTPYWTAAAGARFEHDGLFSDSDSLVVTLNNKWIGSQWLNNASCSPNIGGVCDPAVAAANAKAYTTAPVAGLLPMTKQANLSLTWRQGWFSIEAQVQNLLNEHGFSSAKGTQYIPGTSELATATAQLPTGTVNKNVFQYMTPRSYLLTFKVKF